MPFDPNMQKALMEQAEAMQKLMQKAQKKLEQMVVIGEAGLGLVKVHMTGRHEAKRVEIDDSVTSDKEMLEDLVAAAINDAGRKVEKETRSEMTNITSGMNLPTDFSMPTDDDKK
jgi:DNA-binding YbaB/EbfC family protein